MVQAIRHHYLNIIVVSFSQMKKKKGIVDPHVFLPLNETIMQDNHKIILMKALKEAIIDVKEDRKDIKGHMETLKGILVSLNKLQQFYGNRN